MFKYSNVNKSGAGFTVLELMAAIIVITIGVLSAYGVVQKIISYTSASSDRLAAAYLAQEGVEIVRNIRDTNWIEGENWDNGLGAGVAWEADYNDDSLTVWTDRKLKIDNNVYTYDAGVDTSYRRKITLSSIAGSGLEILVEIKWDIKGKNNTLTVQGNIYDWK